MKNLVVFIFLVFFTIVTYITVITSNKYYLMNNLMMDLNFNLKMLN